MSEPSPDPSRKNPPLITGDRILVLVMVAILLLNSLSLVGIFFGVHRAVTEDVKVAGGNFELSVVAADRFFKGEDVYDFQSTVELNGYFAYTPLMILFGAALSHIFYPLRYLFLLVGMVPLTLLFARSLASRISPALKDRKRLMVWAFVAVAMSSPLLRQLAWGHYIVLGLGAFGLFLLFADTRPKLAGFFFGLSCSFSIYFFIFHYYLFLRKRFSTMVVALITAVGTYGILLFNKASMAGYGVMLKTLNELSIARKAGYPIYFTIRDIQNWLGGDLIGQFLPYAVIGILLVLFSANAFFKSRWDERMVRLNLALLATVFILADPWLSDHHIPIILIAIPLLIGEPGWKWVLPIGYLFTNARIDLPFLAWLGLQTEQGITDPTIGGIVWFSFIRYAGALLLFVYILWLKRKDLSGTIQEIRLLPKTVKGWFCPRPGSHRQKGA
ncbi:MAG: glycosyltransferase family 87 protein [archaeon]